MSYKSIYLFNQNIHMVRNTFCCVGGVASAVTCSVSIPTNRERVLGEGKSVISNHALPHCVLTGQLLLILLIKALKKWDMFKLSCSCNFLHRFCGLLPLMWWWGEDATISSPIILWPCQFF